MDAFTFLRGFFDTMVKEWGGIDHLRCCHPFSLEKCPLHSLMLLHLRVLLHCRMDKYLMLVRKVVRQYLAYCKAHELDETDLDL